MPSRKPPRVVWLSVADGYVTEADRSRVVVEKNMSAGETLHRYSLDPPKPRKRRKA